MDQITLKIHSIVKQACNSGIIGEFDDLKEIHYLDELDMIEILVDIEKAFDLNIPDEKWPNIKSVHEMVNLIKELKEESEVIEN